MKNPLNLYIKTLIVKQALTIFETIYQQNNKIMNPKRMIWVTALLALPFTLTNAQSRWQSADNGDIYEISKSK